MPKESSLTPAEVMQIIEGAELTSPIAAVFKSNQTLIGQVVENPALRDPQGEIPEIFLEVADQIEQLYPEIENPLSLRSLLEIGREIKYFNIFSHISGRILAVTYASGGMESLSGLPRVWLQHQKLPTELTQLIYIRDRLNEAGTLVRQLDQLRPPPKTQRPDFEQMVAQIRNLDELRDDPSAIDYIRGLHNLQNPVSRLLHDLHDELGNGLAVLRENVETDIKKQVPPSK